MAAFLAVNMMMNLPTISQTVGRHKTSGNVKHIINPYGN